MRDPTSHVNLHISTKALMISFLPCVAAPFFCFAFFAAALPFTRFLFAMLAGCWMLIVEGVLTNVAEAGVVIPWCGWCATDVF
jgi:hypothetical protein